MKKQFSKLVDVKSIVTLTMAGVFAYLSIIGKITSEQYMMLFNTVIAFYFGTQHQKNKEIEKS